MPIRHSIIHLIDKKPGSTVAILQVSDTELAEHQEVENLPYDLNAAFNAKAGVGAGLLSRS